MSKVETPIFTNETQPIKMTRGCSFLTHSEANLLRFRSKVRHMTVSSTVQELVQPALHRLEEAEYVERQRLLDDYLDQVFSRTEVGLDAVQDSQRPPFTEVYWVLPKPFVARIDKVVANTRISRDSLMNSILSNAVNMRDSS
jgi:hypothetical protein